MKNLASIKIIFCLAILGYACNSENADKISVETAEETNKAIQKNDISGAAEEKHKVAAEFLVEATSGGLMEVALGNLAQQKSQNNQVKNFGKQMENDHSQVNEKLKALARAQNIVVPATPSNQHQKHINQLAELKGADFDKKYMDMMVNDHHKDIDIFQQAANNSNLEAEVKALAEKTLPTLRQHLQLARKTQSTLK